MTFTLDNEETPLGPKFHPIHDVTQPPYTTLAPHDHTASRSKTQVVEEECLSGANAGQARIETARCVRKPSKSLCCEGDRVAYLRRGDRWHPRPESLPSHRRWVGLPPV